MSERDPIKESQSEKKEESTGFLVGLGLLLISGFFFITSFSIPHPEGWQTAPGMLPMILGGSLFIMAAIITIDTVRQGALRNLFGAVEKRRIDESENSTRGVITAIAGVAIFYFGLLQFLPFEIAAVIFLAAMTQVFWTESSLKQRLLISLVVPFAISIGFQGVFGIPLPGDQSVVQIVTYWFKG